MASPSKGYGGQDGPPPLTVRKPLVNLNREWTKDAECRKPEHEGVNFFGNLSDEDYRARIRKICCSCPVMADCLDYAIENDIRHGMWGGLTPTARGRLRGDPIPVEVV